MPSPCVVRIPAVLAVELLNPYNGIGASQNERHLIRDVHGQPLRRGLFVDTIYGIGADDCLTTVEIEEASITR